MVIELTNKAQYLRIFLKILFRILINFKKLNKIILSQIVYGFLKKAAI